MMNETGMHKRSTVMSRLGLSMLFALFVMFIYSSSSQYGSLKNTKTMLAPFEFSLFTYHSAVELNNKSWLANINWQQAPALKDGHFNLGSSEYALIRLGKLQHQITAKSPLWITILRNNILSPIYLVYLTNEGVSIRPFDSLTTDQKLVRTLLPLQAQNQDIYIVVSGKYLRGSIDVVEESRIFDSMKAQALISGLYFGVMTLLIVCSFVLALVNRSAVYASYAVFSLSLLAWISSGEGWMKSYFPTLISLPFFTANSLGILVCIAFAYFSKQYLQLRVINGRLYTVLNGAQWYMIIVWLLYCTFFEEVPSALYQSIYALTLMVAITIVFVSFVGALLSWRRQRPQAIYYLLSTIVFLFVGFMLALSIANILELPMGWRSMQLASLFEVAMLAVGFIVWHHKRENELSEIENNLKAQASAIAAAKLDFEKLKNNMADSLVPSHLTPQIAQVIALLPDALYIKASGNYAEVLYISGAQQKEALVDCNLQTIYDALGEERLIRCHKSYLVLSTLKYELKRRTSADFDLRINGITIPVGRKYLSAIKSQFERRKHANT